MNVTYEPAAYAEVLETVQWYADVAGPRIADAFETKLDEAVQLLLRFPKLGTPGPSATRMLRLDGFPYTLHYRLEADSIRILAVANQWRRPGYWRGR